MTAFDLIRAADAEPCRPWPRHLLTRAGWTSHSINPGDRVEIRYLPLRGGGNAGEVVTATQLATGKVVSPGEQ